MSVKIGLITLGCAKNRIDSENMLAYLSEAGFELVYDIEGADAVIINTCGFIESAKAEAIGNIIAVGRLKKVGSVKKIIVAGCLSERYREELLREMPEIDAVIGCGSYHRIAEVAKDVIEGGAPEVFDAPESSPLNGDRILTTPSHTAYIKIAEGCDNRCSYCVIPTLRGGYRSREAGDILDEATRLAALGVRELIVVAQDTSRYGTDIYGKRALPELLSGLCAIEGLRWIRLHYLYPDEIDDELINVIASEKKILKYLDIPIQHASDRVLKAMNRRGTKEYLTRLFAKLRARVPDVVFRTSVIVGFPGETREDFEELCGFLKKHRFVRGGVFKYSAEHGSAAARMTGQIDEDEKERRYELACALQTRIIDEYNRSLFGEKTVVLCEGYDDDTRVYFGRTYADSPEVDMLLYFKSDFGINTGEFVTVEVTGETDGELFGKALGIT